MAGKNGGLVNFGKNKKVKIGNQFQHFFPLVCKDPAIGIYKDSLHLNCEEEIHSTQSKIFKNYTRLQYTVMTHYVINICTHAFCFIFGHIYSFAIIVFAGAHVNCTYFVQSANVNCIYLLKLEDGWSFKLLSILYGR